MCLLCWQPDLLVVLFNHHKIAILDVILPSDILQEQLQTAQINKLLAYKPLHQAFSVPSHADSNWEIRVLSWVIGISGLV